VARKTFYDLLNVPADATPEVIAEAFKALALQFHPDRVVHLDDTSQQRALRRMQAISEAFATLRNPATRALYDRCLREGLDYAIEQWNLQPPAPEQQGKGSPAPVRPGPSRVDPARAARVVEAIMALPGMAQASCSQSDNYFDYVLSGRLKAHRYLIHLKNLDAIGVEDLVGIINYADQVGDESGALLSKAYHSYVLVGRSLDDTVHVRATAEQYNARMSRTVRGEPIRGLVLVLDGQRKPYVPYGEYLCPAFTTLQI